MSDNTSKKKNFQITQQAEDRVDAVINNMLTEAKTRAPKNQAGALIARKIKQIDALSEAGFTLTQIYERFNKVAKLGISASSFTQYVRAARKESGSKHYRAREQYRSKKQAVSAVDAEQKTNDAPAKLNAVEVKNGLNCNNCVNAKKKNIGGIEVYHCEACGSDYAVKNDGTMMYQRLN